MKPLEQVLADAREEAQVLRANRASFSVERVEQLLDAISESAEDFITWLSEGDAAIRRGVTVQTMASYFTAMLRDGNARLSGRQRQYRQSAVPRRANTAAAAARAREAARQEKRSA
jgi:hypothetical protein